MRDGKRESDGGGGAAPGDHTAQPAVMHHENGRSAYHLEENVHMLHRGLFGYTKGIVGTDREMKMWVKVCQSINQSINQTHGQS